VALAEEARRNRPVTIYDLLEEIGATEDGVIIIVYERVFDPHRSNRGATKGVHAAGFPKGTPPEALVLVDFKSTGFKGLDYTINVIVLDNNVVPKHAKSRDFVLGHGPATFARPVE